MKTALRRALPPEEVAELGAVSLSRDEALALVERFSRDTVSVHESDGRIVYVAPSCVDLIGYAPEELVGRNARDLRMHDPGRADTGDDIDRVIAGESLESVLFFARHKAGMPVWIEAGIRRIDHGGGTLIVVSSRDVGRRIAIESALRQSEERYRALLADAADVIGTIGLDGRIIEVNRACERLLGFAPDEVIGVDLVAMHAERKSTRLIEAFRSCVEHGESEYLDGSLRCKDGRVVSVDIRARLIEFGGQKVVQVIVHDATASRERERRRLADEVAQRDLLLREVHHRIKNNLQGVAGMLRQLALEKPTLAAPMGEAIGQVQSIAAVYGLQGQSEANCRLSDMLRDIVEITESIWKVSFGSALERCCPAGRCDAVVAEGEAVPLALVFNELLANAAKHGSAGGGQSLALDVSCAQAAVRIEIRNRGRLPAGFDIRSLRGAGTGLRLVHSLLPRRGALLSFEQVDDDVLTTIVLERPAVVWSSMLEKL